MKMAPKIDLEPTLGSNFSFWEAFGAMQKYHDFLMLFLRPKKSKKLAQGAFWEAPAVTRDYFLGIWAPGRRLFARESTLYQGTKGTKYKVQRYKVKRQVRKGNKAVLRDLTRPKAKGLANYIYGGPPRADDWRQNIFSCFYLRCSIFSEGAVRAQCGRSRAQAGAGGHTIGTFAVGPLPVL